MQETRVRSLGWEDPLEKEMVAWEIPQTEKPGGLQSLGSQRAGQDLGTKRQQKSLWASLARDGSEILPG